MFNWFKKYFIPHPGNDHKPHLLRHEGMMLVFTLIVVIELGFLAQVFLVFDRTSFLASVLPSVLTNLTNEERKDNNVPPLTESSLLDQAAKMKAEDMATKGYFAHTSPEGHTPWYWLDQVGYNYSAAGENLAVNFFESSDVSQAWMNSPSHRANIVKPGYKEIGIGVARGVYNGKSTIFVAQFFGTPIAHAATPTPTVKPTPATSTKPITTPTPKPTPKPIPTKVTTTPIKVTTPIGTKVLGEEQFTPSVKTSSKFTRLKNLLEEFSTTPLETATYVYLLIGFLILLALSFVLFINSGIRHPASLVRGALMVSVIIFLFYLNINLVRTTTELPQDTQNAAVITSFAE
jgi:hypothetical protein